MADFGLASEILGAMITPAVLISASGTLVLSTTNRLGRVVDRVRTLMGLAEELDKGESIDRVEAADRVAMIHEQLAFLTSRIRLLQVAVSSLYVAIGTLVSTSFSVGIVSAFHLPLGWLPVALGLTGAGLLFFASMILVREARLAVRSTLHELEHVRRVVLRKTDGIVKKTERDSLRT